MTFEAGRCPLTCTSEASPHVDKPRVHLLRTLKAKWDLEHGFPPAPSTLCEVPFSSGAMSGSTTQSKRKFPGDRVGQKEPIEQGVGLSPRAGSGFDMREAIIRHSCHNSPSFRSWEAAVPFAVRKVYTSKYSRQIERASSETLPGPCQKHRQRGNTREF